MTNDEAVQARSKKMAIGIIAIVFVMFGFSFALVPLYDVFCQVTGLNGKISMQPATSVEANSSMPRQVITLEFLSHIAKDLNITVKPQAPRLSINTGQSYTVNYLAHNPNDFPVTTQAVPSVSPGEASQYLHKVQCFCFNKQTLQAKESKQMAINFYINPTISDSLRTITLSYTFYNVDASVNETIGNTYE